MIQLIITIIIILILLISLMSSLIKEPFYGCDFVPWGTTHKECTATCLNSSYKDLYSLGNPNCDTDDNCEKICKNCTESDRCSWVSPDDNMANAEAGLYEYLQLDESVNNCDSIVITITRHSKEECDNDCDEALTLCRKNAKDKNDSKVGLPICETKGSLCKNNCTNTDGKYIIHYRDDENSKINMLEIPNSDNKITFSVDNDNSHKSEVLKTNTTYKLIVYAVHINPQIQTL